MVGVFYSNEVILERALGVLDYASGIRREIHRYPEEGMKEFKTSALIRRELDALGIPYRDQVGGTGVVGIITGTSPGPERVLAIRADMDAISVIERKTVDYASRVPGMMHACGHDAHVAVLLGAARVLKEMRDGFSGSVKLVFQPAEEGPGGAEPMIRDGVLKDPDVDAMVAFHVSSSEKTGRVGLRPGVCHAAQDDFEIVIKGKGGHAASPHLSVDAIVLAGQAIVALQTILSRRVHPLKSAVFTIGTIKGGYRRNIIADTVEMTGTYRLLDNELKPMMRGWITEILEGVTKSGGGDYEVRFIDGYPASVNNPELYEKVRGYLEDLLDGDTVFRVENPSMGAEDFSYFAMQVPALFMRLGTGGMNGEFSHPHHSPEFDVDEKAFVNGVASFVKIALGYLGDPAVSTK